MPSGVEIEVEGAARFSATLRGAARKIENMSAASSKVAADVAQKARGRAPRRSGALARSTTGRGKGDVAEMTATVIYAGVIHNGWPRHNISPQPYLRKTAEDQLNRAAETYATEAQKALNSVKGA